MKNIYAIGSIALKIVFCAKDNVICLIIIRFKKKTIIFVEIHIYVIKSVNYPEFVKLFIKVKFKKKISRILHLNINMKDSSLKNFNVKFK